MIERQEHWQTVYETKEPDAVSWYQAVPTMSLNLIGGLNLPDDAAIIDVGAGASMLADSLISCGFHDVTLVDLSSAALDQTKARLGDAANSVRFVAGDVTGLDLGRQFDLWHDRAVLHFLTDDADQQKYRTVLMRHLKPGGYAVISAFAVGGPEKCSGLSVRQYDAARLMDLLGDGFELLEEHREEHTTPWGSEQAFACFLVQKRA